MVINPSMQKIIDDFVTHVAKPGEEGNVREVLQNVADQCPDEEAFYETIYRTLKKMTASPETTNVKDLP